MAIDNSLYDSLQITYTKIKDYFDKVQLGREHSTMMIKHEELAELLETFDVEALEEQTKDINGLHEQLKQIKEISNTIIETLNGDADSIEITTKVVSGLDEVFVKITNIIL